VVEYVWPDTVDVDVDAGSTRWIGTGVDCTFDRLLSCISISCLIPSVELSSDPDGSGGEHDLGLNGGYEESGDGFFGETVRLSDFERTFVWSADSFVQKMQRCERIWTCLHRIAAWPRPSCPVLSCPVLLTSSQLPLARTIGSSSNSP
jgi:hypothetical protein